MNTKPIIFVTLLLLAAMVVPVVAAPVEYPQEYYKLGILSSSYLHDERIEYMVGANLNWYDKVGYFASLASARELRRQSILLEKQNELLAEQNHNLWVQTCYAALGGDIYNYRNASAWEQECTAAGYPV